MPAGFRCGDAKTEAMRKTDLLSAIAMIGLAASPAMAASESIPGAVPRLAARFTPYAAAPGARPPAAVEASLPGAYDEAGPRAKPESAKSGSAKPESDGPGATKPASDRPGPDRPVGGMAAWTMPMMERRLGAAEREASLAPDLVEAIVRIEGLYDPTRLDMTGTRARQQVRPGTASMNNVFGDRWHIGDTDANVSYRVHYIAQAWQMPPDRPCTAYDRHRPGFHIVELTTISKADCVRITSLRGAQPDLFTRLVVAAAPMSLPVFAAPEPGARLSSADFWAAQKTKVEAIAALAAFRRASETTRLAKKAGVFRPLVPPPLQNRPL